MKLFPGKVDTIASEVVTRLSQDGSIELGDRNEAQLDVAAVLKEYLRVDKELTERAKDMLEIRGLPQSALGRTKRSLAEQKDFGLGPEAVTWICNQMIETFMQSSHVEEIFADDAQLRRVLKDILTRHMSVEEELDREVRDRMKNLEEGTSNWDVEYQRVMEQVKQKHGLAD